MDRACVCVFAHLINKMLNLCKQHKKKNVGGVRSLIKILMEYFYENLHARRNVRSLMNYYYRRGGHFYLYIYRMWWINKYKFEFNLTTARQYTICSITGLKSPIHSGKQKKNCDLLIHMEHWTYMNKNTSPNMVKYFVEL